MKTMWRDVDRRVVIGIIQGIYVIADSALAQEQKGLLSLSIANFEQPVSLCGGPLFLALLSRACALSGERTKALEILNRLEALSKETYVSPFDIAVIHIGVGDLTSAFERLEEAYRQRVFRLVELTMPMFDNLRPAQLIMR